MAGTAGGEMNWEQEFAAIEHGLGQDTAACKYGGHRIHWTPGGWKDDDNNDFCLQAVPFCSAPDGPDALHEPVIMPRQGRPGAR